MEYLVGRNIKEEILEKGVDSFENYMKMFRRSV